MAWRIEWQHVDLAEMEHVTCFVEDNVKTRDGQPTRHLLQIRLGEALKLRADGHLMDAEKKVYDVKAKQNEVLNSLNENHRRARLFAQLHGAPVSKGPRPQAR